MAKAKTAVKKVAESNGHGGPRFTVGDLAPKDAPKGESLRVVITPLREKVVEFKIIGTAPLVMHHFSASKAQKMIETQEAGQQGKSKKVRTPRDFKKDFENASHKSREGWYGLPAAAFRCGLIETCRMVGFKMTVAKMSVFIEADGYDRESGQPLVRLKCKEPKMTQLPVRNASGVCDIRARPMWESWEAILRVRFDEDQFSVTDIANLLHRMGAQNGVGEGRANSRESAGMGWGSFRIEMGK